MWTAPGFRGSPILIFRDKGVECMKKQWSDLWLSYKRIETGENKAFFQTVYAEDFPGSQIVKNAIKEIQEAAHSMFGTEVRQAERKEDATILLRKDETLEIPGSFRLRDRAGQIRVYAGDENGILYGVFQLLRMAAMKQDLTQVDKVYQPENPLRMFNHWDNMTGDIERGYSGNSFFFENNEVIVNERTRDYARLMASIGINAVVINNVNVKQAASYLITDRYYSKVAQMAALFAEYGIRFFLSLNYASPIELGGLDSADPFEEKVISWWKDKMKEAFTKIPNLGGFLVKADSEGRPGPFTYGRTQADGANMLADIVKPYGGIIIWRCFVYNCTQDWRDYKTDRARAGYDNFIAMDGDYKENVILQIKNGPMDFQIREPISPLLGGLKKTNQMLEVQIAQEYTGHQIDICYLIPMFKEILDFQTYCNKTYGTVADVISGRTLGNKNTGIAAVINTGNDSNWTGNVLAAANLYGFGRLAFDMTLSAEEILKEWILQTFGYDKKVEETILGMLMPSREIYEKYTSPLGIGWMVTPNTHYGCSVDGYEYSRWGTYHRADHLGIGVDRSHNGTGYAGQYYEPNASMYDNPETCPEELLLFFHHMPYTHKLKSGKTIIQHIYDTHFEGVEEVEKMVAAWDGLKEVLPEEEFTNAAKRLQLQLTNAKEWRDQVNSYFFRKSGIADEKNRPIY